MVITFRLFAGILYVALHLIDKERFVTRDYFYPFSNDFRAIDSSQSPKSLFKKGCWEALATI